MCTYNTETITNVAMLTALYKYCCLFNMYLVILYSIVIN